MDYNVTIERALFAQLLEAQKEADMLKNLLVERRYLGIKGEEVALLCKLLGLNEKE